MIPTALSIAGSDPSGGAGIQADLKAFSANRVYGMAAITALTVQNTQGVRGVHLIPPEFVASQIAAVFDDIRVGAVKIGMIANAGIAAAVAKALGGRDAPVVLDPVMVAKGGAALLDPEAVATLRSRLVPRATILTPNLPEAAVLLDTAIADSREAMEDQARALLALGPDCIVLKGGHLGGDASPDCIAFPDRLVWLDAPRDPTRNTHGTGCTLSAAIAAHLARGAGPEAAVRAARAYVTAAIAESDTLDIGSGHGPVHHFHALWGPE